MCILLISVSLVGLYGVARGNKRLVDLYFKCVVLIIAFQAVVAIQNFLTGAAWADRLLDRSWNTALVNDPELIDDLQTEFHCRGFDSRSAGSPEAYPGSEGLPTCGEILKVNFGSRLEKLRSMLLMIRLLQLSGVLLLSILFKYLALIDQEESDKEDNNTLVTTAEKLGFGLTEKQLEDKHACVPLLLADDIEESSPPPYFCESVSVNIRSDLLEPDREARGL